MAHAKSKLHTDDFDRLRTECETLCGDVALLVQDLKTFARAEERSLADRAGERVVALKSTGEQQLDLAKARARDAAQAAEKTVREHPGYAVAGAAALGFLIGALTLRRR